MIALKAVALSAVLLLLIAATTKDSIIGKWGSRDGDFVEFAPGGKGRGFNHRLKAVAYFNWEVSAGNSITFSHPEKNLHNVCKFKIQEMAHYDTITLSDCFMMTSRGIVKSWSGRKGFALAGK